MANGVHVIFFPFPRKNCVVPSKEPNGKESDWAMRSAFASDPKAVRLLTLDTDRTRSDSVSASAAKSGDVLWKDIGPGWDSALEYGLDDVTTLYVVGHCRAGSTSLSSPDDKVEISADDLVSKHLNLIDREWSGKLKLYACESGSRRWGGLMQPFAKRVLDRLGKTHKKLSIWGYTGSVSIQRDISDDKKLGRKTLDGVRAHDLLVKIQ